jgi:ABC-type transport system involved in multi-copper enzyme maturation permease subunit
MIGATRAEFLKLRRWPAIWIMGGLSVFFLLLWNYALEYAYYYLETSGAIKPEAPPHQRIEWMLPDQLIPVLMIQIVSESSALLLLTGALVSGSEYSWGTIKTRYSVNGSRLDVYISQCICLAIVSAVVVLSMAVAGGLAGTIIGSVENETILFPPISDTIEGLASAWLILFMWASVGLMLGMVFRGPSLAIGLGLVWVFIIERTFRLFALQFSIIDEIEEWLPGANAATLAMSSGVRGASQATLLLPVGSGLSTWILIAYIIASACIGIILTRRDVF